MWTTNLVNHTYHRISLYIYYKVSDVKIVQFWKFLMSKKLVFSMSWRYVFSMPKKFTFHDSVNPIRHCWHTGCPRTYLIHILDLILTIYPFRTFFIQILDGPIWTWFWQHLILRHLLSEYWTIQVGLDFWQYIFFWLFCSEYWTVPFGPDFVKI